MNQSTDGQSLVVPKKWIHPVGPLPNFCRKKTNMPYSSKHPDWDCIWSGFLGPVDTFSERMTGALGMVNSWFIRAVVPPGDVNVGLDNSHENSRYNWYHPHSSTLDIGVINASCFIPRSSLHHRSPSLLALLRPRGLVRSEATVNSTASTGNAL